MVHIFLLDPYVGGDMDSEHLREVLGQMQDLEYYIITLTSDWYQTDYIKRIQEIFDEDDIRFYVCGSLETLNHTINCIDDLQAVEIAYIPAFPSDSFMKVFGEKASFFHDYDRMISGKAIPMDYIRTNHGKALNVFSVGYTLGFHSTSFVYRHKELDVHIIRGFLILLRMMLGREMDMKVEADGYSEQLKADAVFFGNGCCHASMLYYEKHPSLVDGRGTLCIHRKAGIFDVIRQYVHLRRKNYDLQKKDATSFLSCDVTLHSEEPVMGYMDEMPICTDRNWEIHMVRQGMQFVLPRGVSL